MTRSPADNYKAVLDYATDVPLFESGAAAAEHGRRRIDNPSLGALRAMAKIDLIRTKTKE